LISCKEISNRRQGLEAFLKSKLLHGVAKTASSNKHVLALDIMQRNFKQKTRPTSFLKSKLLHGIAKTASSPSYTTSYNWQGFLLPMMEMLLGR